jgi:DNA polymerase III subunit delta
VNAQSAIRSASAGQEKLLPVYILAGTEQVLRDEVVAVLRTRCLEGGPAAFNEDRFTAGECEIDRVLAAAKTLPMMSPKRFVMLRNLDRWDAGDAASAAFEKLARYAEAPSESTCLVLVCDKLDGRRKLAAHAKKAGYLVTCEPLGERELVSYIENLAQERSCAIAASVAARIGQLVGPELAPVRDAVERLSLYVAQTKVIDDAAVTTCVTRVRTEDTWALVDCLSRGEIGAALSVLADVFDPRDRGLPLVGAIAWSFRQLLKLRLAELSGMRTDEAARSAGVFQPGKARDLSLRAKAIGEKELERWLCVVADADRELKRSRRPAEATLETMILRLAKG